MAALSFRSLPDAARFVVTATDGAALPVYELPGPATAVGLLVAHANGFAAGSYGPWLTELAADFRVFAFDARGHGGSSWPEGPLHQVFHVDRFADDLRLVAKEVRARLDGSTLHFVGHSLGAAAALRWMGAGTSPPWRASILFEPPVFPPPASPHYEEACAKQRALIDRSAARRALWASPEAMAAALAARGVFSRFRPDLLAAHCRATLRPRLEVGYGLACPPAVESTIFMSHRGADTWGRLSAINARIHLVSGDPSLPDRDWVSAVVPDIAAAIPGARLTVLRQAGHMMMFEHPEVCRELILRECEATCY